MAGDGETLVAMFDTLSKQITSRQDASDDNFRDFASAVDQRFKTYHEDARRDRREVLGAIRDMRFEHQRSMHSIERRLIDVCDKGGEEHDAFDRRIRATEDELADLRARKEERQAIMRIGVKALGIIKDQGPWMMLAGSAVYAAMTLTAAQAHSETMPPEPIARSVMLHIPPAPLALRGRS